jgi:hypothetical protein
MAGRMDADLNSSEALCDPPIKGAEIDVSPKP